MKQAVCKPALSPMNGTPLTQSATPPDDFVIDQGWSGYTAQDHAIWRRLFERQSKTLPGRACEEYLNGLRGLDVAADGLRIYGSGIVSSRSESVYALEDPAPNRIGFDLPRIMRTGYRIDDLQTVYFVIESFDQLFDATRPDFTGYYETLKRRDDYAPETALDSDLTVPPNPAA